ncbi:CDP-alcohol phosphatidyltransferase family protein [Pseudonocardia abyssalis]|jgi:phosphatidylserine synthase|uniref:CDP-alcohol phosphatidyltransferase family protein n=1 Tax=Pseudonocardia abyssalis TaxID=2792008 RepID=A0ABS6US03_9PSEU|nr:CDP-alcohol phosphatidyltransferase family protein [Pseudonocardia abyssalis]MBW0115655.1 CDP-alcohol phosphatidyltransferase family protein [Pseudonocardia abyssalis]MBW0135000.1 CDP-alcohol phosphatidyltransferase family protein [Pseudonocardia abyssalis]
MFDARARRLLEHPLDRAAAALDVAAVTPDRITAAGLVLGLGSAGAAAAGLWTAAVLLWLASRLADGLDGPLARRRRTRGEVDAGAGGFFDITADFTVYGATVVGVAVGSSAELGGGPLWPFLLVLLAYYINGAAFLAFSSIAERTGATIDDGRSLSFLGGLAEGGETIVVHTVWLLFPFWAPQIAVVWAALVGVSAAHRIVAGYRALR